MYWDYCGICDPCISIKAVSFRRLFHASDISCKYDVWVLENKSYKYPLKNNNFFNLLIVFFLNIYIGRFFILLWDGFLNIFFYG